MEYEGPYLLQTTCGRNSKGVENADESIIQNITCLLTLKSTVNQQEEHRSEMPLSV